MVLKNSLFYGLVFSSVVTIGCEEVLEPSLENQNVIALAPVDNLLSTNPSQTFYWEKMQGTTKYQLQVVSPAFDSIVQLISDTTVISNQFQLSLSKGVYQWRVRAENNSTQSGFSAKRTMTIQ